MVESNEVEVIKGIQAIHAETRDDWRTWLDENCHTEKSVWLIIYQKKSDKPSVRYLEAIVDALCFGWVDSKSITRDSESCYLFFSQRKPTSTWGKINRERAEELIRQGLMMPSGLAAIEHAKKTGTWDVLAEAQDGVIPADLQALFDDNDTAFKNFQAFPPSSQRLILEWIARAKRPETRQRRMETTVELAANNIRANHQW